MESEKGEMIRLLEELAHKIRTPLSIIQNELSSIKGKIDPDEHQAILEACREINAILKESLKP